VKLAVIPPLSRIKDVAHRDVQLLLPQLLVDQGYEWQYAGSSAGDTYRIMDNGAAEGVHFTPDMVYMAAEACEVSEVVIGDVLRDGPASHKMMSEWKPSTAFKHMYVVHGDSMADVYERAMQAQQYDFVTCLGLPRDLFDTVCNNRLGGALRGRLATAIGAAYQRPIEIHLLGSHPLWYNEAMLVADNPYIRSMDTSLPYYLTMYGYRLNDAPPGLKRPASFFNWEPDTQAASQIMWDNIHTMDEWVTGGNRT
jgi:hypothetical protein